MTTIYSLPFTRQEMSTSAKAAGKAAEPDPVKNLEKTAPVTGLVQ
jgi:hypothetical protein